MKSAESVIDLVGGTPLVRLNNIVDDDMATVYAKMENLNPSGSVKDRMAINMVNAPRTQDFSGPAVRSWKAPRETPA